MFHFDSPETLNDIGGWLNRDIVNKFGNYARVLYKNFGDRVKKWATINEPLSVSTWGYCGIDGNVAAPGNFAMACQWTKYLSAHYFILAHAKAYRIYDLEFRWRQKGSLAKYNQKILGFKQKMHFRTSWNCFERWLVHTTIELVR